MRKSQHFICIVAFMTSLTGCASLGEVFTNGFFGTSQGRFLNEFLQKGREFEEKRDVVSALKQYKLAATVNPSSQEAIEGQTRVRREIEKEAKKHYEAGVGHQKEGKYGRARQEFLMALRLKPDYPEVVNMLSSRKRIKIKRYMVHTIRPGETLSKVAEIYYGEYHKFPIIAKYNDITDATHVRPGQEIKVPEIEGVAFLVGREPVETEETEVAYSGFRDWEAYNWGTVEAGGSEVKLFQGEQEPEEQMTIYRDYGIDLYHKKQYQEALVALDLALKMEPQDKESLEYAQKSHFQNAMSLFDNEDYLGAKREFEASLKYKSHCQECLAYVKKSEDLYKEMHYKRGIQYFGKERLRDAIQEWELVRALDPNYKRVEYLIDKAETILNNIEKLKEEHRKELQE